MINKSYLPGFWYFDENGMLLERDWSDGKGDSVGRNAFAYICWPNETWLKDTILQCVKMGDDGFVQFYRYPGKGGDTMSRDHVGAILLALLATLPNIIEGILGISSLNGLGTTSLLILVGVILDTSREIRSLRISNIYTEMFD